MTVLSIFDYDKAEPLETLLIFAPLVYAAREERRKGEKEALAGYIISKLPKSEKTRWNCG